MLNSTSGVSGIKVFEEVDGRLTMKHYRNTENIWFANGNYIPVVSLWGTYSTLPKFAESKL